MPNPKLADALSCLDNQVCPIDGQDTQQYSESDEREHRFERCPNKHTWPLRYEDGAWIPNEELTQEGLEEYGKA